MAQNVAVCDVDPELQAMLKKFRMRKEENNAAIVMKIDKEKRQVVLDEEYEDMTPEELAEELPALQPRYVVYSYKYNHDDGRVSFPLCFIFISPQGAKPEMMMMYAGSKTNLVNEAGLTKVFELRSADEFTEEWLREKLRFFR